MDEVTPVQKIAELASELRELKSKKEVAEEDLKKINKRIEELQRWKLPELLDLAGLKSTRVDGVGTVYLQGDVDVGLLAEDRERFYEWLSENGNGDLIKEYVHPGTLKSFVKEQFENGLPLPEYVKANPFLKATLRRS